MTARLVSDSLSGAESRSVISCLYIPEDGRLLNERTQVSAYLAHRYVSAGQGRPSRLDGGERQEG